MRSCPGLCTAVAAMVMMGCRSADPELPPAVVHAQETSLPPDAGFFENCAFVCVDIQPGRKHTMTADQLPKGWRDAGFTAEDVNAAVAYQYDVAYPNARRVADACRDLKLPMIFIHWGYQFEDAMDLAPPIRESFLREYGDDYVRWPHHISRGDSRPADILGVRDGEYIISKRDQDAFGSSSIDFVLKNLGVRNIVFVGGHTGACLGKTAASARKHGFHTLCIEDATFDARESTRIPNMAMSDYDHRMTTDEFLAVVKGRRSPGPPAVE